MDMSYHHLKNDKKFSHDNRIINNIYLEGWDYDFNFIENEYDPLKCRCTNHGIENRGVAVCKDGEKFLAQVFFDKHVHVYSIKEFDEITDSVWSIICEYYGLIFVDGYKIFLYDV